MTKYGITYLNESEDRAYSSMSDRIRDFITKVLKQPINEYEEDEYIGWDVNMGPIQTKAFNKKFGKHSKICLREANWF
jgi:hypothetical protein